MQEFSLKIRMALNNILPKKCIIFHFNELRYVSCIVNKKSVEFKCKIRTEYKPFQFSKVKSKTCVMITASIHSFKKITFIGVPLHRTTIERKLRNGISFQQLPVMVRSQKVTRMFVRVRLQRGAMAPNSTVSKFKDRRQKIHVSEYSIRI